MRREFIDFGLFQAPVLETADFEVFDFCALQGILEILKLNAVGVVVGSPVGMPGNELLKINTASVLLGPSAPGYSRTLPT